MLTLNSLVLDAELNSLSNTTTFSKKHRSKMDLMAKYLIFDPIFSEKLSFLSRFIQGLVLTLNSLVLDGELNSLSNGIEFDRGQRH